MKPRPAGGQEEGCMFWSAHFMHGAPNSELGAQITRNPFRLTASMSLDFSIDWWVRTYCTDPPINGALSRRQKPSLRPAGVLLRPTEDLFRPAGALLRSTWVHPETKKGPPKTDRGPPQVDRSASYTDKGLAIDRALLRPTEALLKSAEALHIMAKALPENDRDSPQIDTGPPQVIFFNGYEYTCLYENRSESRIAFFVLVMIFDSRHIIIAAIRNIKYFCLLSIHI